MKKHLSSNIVFYFVRVDEYLKLTSKICQKKAFHSGAVLYTKGIEYAVGKYVRSQPLISLEGHFSRGGSSLINTEKAHIL